MGYATLHTSYKGSNKNDEKFDGRNDTHIDPR